MPPVARRFSKRTLVILGLAGAGFVVAWVALALPLLYRAAGTRDQPAGAPRPAEPWQAAPGWPALSPSGRYRLVVLSERGEGRAWWRWEVLDARPPSPAAHPGTASQLRLAPEGKPCILWDAHDRIWSHGVTSESWEHGDAVWLTLYWVREPSGACWRIHTYLGPKWDWVGDPDSETLLFERHDNVPPPPPEPISRLMAAHQTFPRDEDR